MCSRLLGAIGGQVYKVIPRLNYICLLYTRILGGGVSPAVQERHDIRSRGSIIFARLKRLGRSFGGQLVIRQGPIWAGNKLD